MRIAANLCLALSVLLTLPLAPFVDSLRRLAGPDRTGAAFQYFIVCGPRWILMAVALFPLVSRGGFDWTHASRGVQGVLVFIVHVAMGVTSIWALFIAEQRSNPARQAWIPLSFVIPLVVAAFAAAAWNPELGVSPPLVRGALVSAAGLSLLALVAGSVGAAVAGQRRARENEREQADRERLRHEHLAKMAALPADAPLEEWFRWIHGEDDVESTARAAIKAHPRLGPELARLVRAEDKLLAREAMAFFSYLHEPPPPEPLEAVRDRLRGLVQAAEALPPSPPDAREALFEREERIFNGVLCALDVVRRAGLDLRPELRALAALAAPVDAAIPNSPGKSSRAYYVRYDSEERVRRWDER